MGTAETGMIQSGRMAPPLMFALVIMRMTNDSHPRRILLDNM